MKRLIGVTIVGLLLGGAVVGAEASGKHRKHKKTKHAVVHEDRSRVAVHVAFGKSDVEVIRTHYRTRHRNLPPGLAKKVARGGTLPPGWQKRYEPFPEELERRCSRLPAGYHRGIIDGHAVIFNPSSSLIIDVAVLF